MSHTQVRTTAAVTGISSGIADNVLPPSGSINVNFRLLPGDSEASLYSYLEELIDSDMKYVVLLPLGGQPASLASNVTAAGGRHFQLLKTAIQSVHSFKGVGPPDVAPMLMTGETDRGGQPGATLLSVVPRLHIQYIASRACLVVFRALKRCTMLRT